MYIMIEKVISYAYHRDEITVEDIETIVHGKLHNRIFDMITAIVNKNQKEALRQFAVSMEEIPGEPSGGTQGGGNGKGIFDKRKKKK